VRVDRRPLRDAFVPNLWARLVTGSMSCRASRGRPPCVESTQARPAPTMCL
jgi:hypothetical protein